MDFDTKNDFFFYGIVSLPIITENYFSSNVNLSSWFPIYKIFCVKRICLIDVLKFTHNSIKKKTVFDIKFHQNRISRCLSSFLSISLASCYSFPPSSISSPTKSESFFFFHKYFESKHLMNVILVLYYTAGHGRAITKLQYIRVGRLTRAIGYVIRVRITVIFRTHIHTIITLMSV